MISKAGASIYRTYARLLKAENSEVEVLKVFHDAPFMDEIWGLIEGILKRYDNWGRYENETKAIPSISISLFKDRYVLGMALCRISRWTGFTEASIQRTLDDTLTAIKSDFVNYRIGRYCADKYIRPYVPRSKSEREYFKSCREAGISC